MTKLGKIAVTKTTSDSAATRSRKIHITQVKKASPLGRKLESQYDTMENSSEIKTAIRVSNVNNALMDTGHAQRYGRPIRKFDITKGVAPYNPLARSLAKVARSSRKAGTYATAMKDMKADPKN